MFITVHAAAAVIIGKHIANPLLAFVLGFLLHFPLDIIPHGDENLGKKFFGLDLSRFREASYFKSLALYGSLDACSLGIFLIYLFKNFDFAHSDSVVWSMIGGILPDILVALYKLSNFKFLKWFNDLHNNNHHLALNRMKQDIPLAYGLLLQLLLMSTIILLIYVI